ncbi:MAG TPA: 30S ribosomal protein S13 [Candidatus Nanoarchaeia archaeon]|nr:30S ribosomal protein S13 [Candidatus Nanoarchaeia archaeon]
MEKTQTVVKQYVRILSTDIPGAYSLKRGLAQIRGISINLANAICVRLNLDSSKLLHSHSDAEVKELEIKLKTMKVDSWLMNRQNDYDTGVDRHVLTTDIMFQRDLDIKRMQKIKSYKGVRHAMGQPVRGQRTKAHFRKGRALGVQKTKAVPGKAAASAKKA